ncbi:LysR family transcriptional regulator [Nakamurella sp.]|uniref:LysR family transcriptional regulator n=1 Tax=Nakamurella sp. TaxID=1869182 RepID=UPI003784DFF4
MRSTGPKHTVDLRLLRCFVAVADAGSVTAAAQELYVSQPSLSRQLHRLEREIGLLLFRPVDGRLVLTSAGRELLPRARTLLATATDVQSFAGDIACGAITTVQITASAVTAYDVLAPFIASASRDLPPLAVRSAEAGQVYASLDGNADLVVDEDIPPGHLAVSVLARRTVHAFVPATHDLAANGSVTLTELVGHALILPDRRRHVRHIIDEATTHAGLVYRTAEEYDCPPVGMANAAAGRGVAVGCGEPAFDLVPVPVMTAAGRMTAPLFASWLADHHAAATLADVAAGLSDHLVSGLGSGPGDAGGFRTGGEA